MTPAITAIEELRHQLTLSVWLRKQMVAKGVAQRTPFVCAEDLLLQHGAVYIPSSDPPPTQRIPRGCFQQSYRMALRKRRSKPPWVYVEGFALSHAIGLAIPHAWVARPDTPNVAHDLAWDSNPHDVYLGIAFRPTFVRAMRIASACKYFGVIDAWWARHPLLTGVVRLDDVIWRNDEQPKTKRQLRGILAARKARVNPKVGTVGASDSDSKRNG